MRDELVRDRIIVGVCDRELSEKLQLVAGLTLEDSSTTERIRKNPADSCPGRYQHWWSIRPCEQKGKATQETTAVVVDAGRFRHTTEISVQQRMKYDIIAVLQTVLQN